MSDINHIIVSGRLVDAPTTTALADGGSVTHLRVANDLMGRGRDGQDRPNSGYVDVSSFGAGGEAAARHLTRGSAVLIDGRLEHRQWTTAEGERRQGHGIVGQVEFLGPPREPATPGPDAAAGVDPGAHGAAGADGSVPATGVAAGR